MLKHIVLLKFKPETSGEEKEDLERKLKALPSKIPEIKGYEMGFDIIQSQRSYDFGLIATFENLDALKTYQQHPDHVVVLNKVLEICDGIIAVDFEV
ncbi:MAG TPA: Dabb family protein [Deltaproteobacteria bacterium]|nr:Dabb family protein [Deltaproteobacteria bacterium]HEC31712.1 Dabb family protein [Deltaproteobacteria bacterium]